MKRGLMMILASAAIASSLLAPDVQARGGGGGHMGGFGGAHIGAHVAGARIAGIGGRRTIGFGAVRIGGFGAGDVAGIHRGIHRLGYGTGIHRGALSVSAAPAVGQTATPNGYTRGYASAPALAEVPNSPVGGRLRLEAYT